MGVLLLYRGGKVKSIKKLGVLILTVMLFVVGMSSTFAATEEIACPRMYSQCIGLFGDVRDGVVLTEVEVDAPLSTTSISLLCILREENDAGNYIIVDTWTDSAEGDYLLGEYSYSPASDTRKYELSVRVGIYDENGLVGYDYETLTNID